MRRIRWLAWMAAAAALAGSACTLEQRQNMGEFFGPDTIDFAAAAADYGRMAVIPGTQSTEQAFVTFATSKGQGVGKGAGHGATQGALDFTAGFASGGCDTVLCIPMLVVAPILGLAVGAVVGGIEGYVVAVPGKTSDQIEAELGEMLDRLQPNRALTAAAMQSLGRYPADVQQRVALRSAMELDHQLREAGFDSVVEISATRTGFMGGKGRNPKVRFFMEGEARVRETTDGAVIHRHQMLYLGDVRPYQEWFQRDAVLLRRALEDAFATLGQRALDLVLLPEAFPFTSRAKFASWNEGYGTCWLQPLMPRTKSEMRARFTFSTGMIYYRVAVPSNFPGPALRWEAFPRPWDLQRYPDSPIVRSIGNVTYDVRIWETFPDQPRRLLEEASGLPEPSYTPKSELHENTVYFWTFRARYTAYGRQYATPWAFAGPLARSGGVTCKTDEIPEEAFYRFVLGPESPPPEASPESHKP